MLDLQAYYHITNGTLKGYVLRPKAISKCGSFGFFKGPHTNVEYRVHKKYLSTEEPDRSISKTKAEENECMATLHVAAHTYVSSENIKRIEGLRSTLRERIDTNMAEVNAIRAGTKIARINLERILNILLFLTIIVLLMG